MRLSPCFGLNGAGNAATAAPTSACAAEPGHSLGSTAVRMQSADLFRGLAARAADWPPRLGSAALSLARFLPALCLARFLRGGPGGAPCATDPSWRMRSNSGAPGAPSEGLSTPQPVPQTVPQPACSISAVASTPHTCVTVCPARRACAGVQGCKGWGPTTPGRPCGTACTADRPPPGRAEKTKPTSAVQLNCTSHSRGGTLRTPAANAEPPWPVGGTEPCRWSSHRRARAAGSRAARLLHAVAPVCLECFTQTKASAAAACKPWARPPDAGFDRSRWATNRARSSSDLHHRSATASPQCPVVAVRQARHQAK